MITDVNMTEIGNFFEMDVYQGHNLSCQTNINRIHHLMPRNEKIML